MEIQITTRHVQASDGLHEVITEKLNHLGKFYEKITSCHVILDSEHTDKVAEIVVNVMGTTLTAKSKSDNIGKSVEIALNKLERQLKKSNEKVKNHKAANVEE